MQQKKQKKQKSLGPYLGNLSLFVVVLGFLGFKFGLPILGGEILRAPWYGFGLAFFEAGIAGGLADWFAVTALFRYPLGIPIPHTNLLVEKRHSLEDNIEAMIRQLLSPENVRDMLARMRLPEMVSQSLSSPRTREVLHREIPELLDSLLASIGEKKLRQSARWGSALLLRFDWAPPIRALLAQSKADGSLERLLSRGLLQVIRLFDANADAIAETLDEKVRQHRGVELLDRVVHFFTGRDIKQKLLPLLRSELVAMAHDPEHPLRKALLDSLERFLTDLENNESTRAETNRWIKDLLREIDLPTRLEGWLQDGLKGLQDVVRHNPAAVEGLVDDLLDRAVELLREETLDRRIKGLVTSLLEGRFVDWVAAIARFGLTRMSDEQFSGFIEERVYEDLQYIRLNGAVVGGLAGMLIYALSLL